MTAPRRHLPLPVRLINATGRVFSRLALNLPSLDEEALLRAALKQTGLDDFGPVTFRAGLQELLESIEHDAALTTIGRLFTRGQIVGILANRLMLIDHRKRHPELAHEQISQPLFVLGLPRTGTSILHALLAQDPAHRSPLAWEVNFPCPPPEKATYDTDSRILRTDRQLDQLRKLAPGFDAIHPMDARLPQECVAILTHEFQSIQFTTTYDVPSYLAWLERQDMRPAYRFHRQFLQHLQSRRPGGRWVLKTPAHLMAIDALLDVYPDAMIVQTHRDPLEVMASVSSLHYVLRSATSDSVDPHYTGRQQMECWSRTLRRGMEARDRHTRQAGQFFDLHYPDLLADPLGCVRHTYEHFDLTLTSEAVQRMERFLADHSQHKHGVHRYTPEDFGIEPVRDAQHFQDYYNRHEVKRTNP